MTSEANETEEKFLNEIIGLLQELSKQDEKPNDLESKCRRSCDLLEWFSEHYKNDRKFTQREHKDLFKQLFSIIMSQRLPVMSSSEEIKLNMVITLRMLMRDSSFQHSFMRHPHMGYYSEMFLVKTNNYLVCAVESFDIDLTAHLASIFHKLSTNRKNHQELINRSIHTTMLHLLAAGDVFILHCALHTLIALADRQELRTMIVDQHLVELVVQIIQEFDDYSKCCAADLLRRLSCHEAIQEQMMIYDTLPVLLSVLNDGEKCDLLWHVVWILVQLCSDTECQRANEIRLLGGVPVLLNLLNTKRELTCGRYKISSGYARRGRTAVTPLTPNKEELTESKIKLFSACCAALTELSLDDRCTQTIVQSNGLYIIAQLILPIPERNMESRQLLQQNAFRALRFLFSMERNRKLFKRLFPPSMFQSFIDIGHYVRESDKYLPLVELLNSMEDEALDEVRSSVEELNENKSPKQKIREYDVYDILGQGGFGCVYRVKKGSNQTPLALKEVRIISGGGKKVKERQKKEIDEIVRELSIIREQLRHPNVVRYYSTFQENDKLYIEMELIEGASLQDHFNSLKEKHELMEENRLWKVFIQMCLALRYLHCDKRIVHRDLSPNNVMLGENDKVTITDFGLAKQKPDSSNMTSMVGTILYNCPEIIKSEPYNEKADIWALGCILYQMATLSPPFLTSNMLSLAKHICDGEFPPIDEQKGYTKLVNKTVASCLTVDPSSRPDIIGVCAVISDPLMRYTDHIAQQHLVAEKRVEKERRRTQRHFYEAQRNRQNYQTLFQASQESSNISRFEGSNGSMTSQSSDNPAMRSNSDESEVFVVDNATADTPAKTTRPVSAGTKPLPPSPDLQPPRRALSFDLSARSNEHKVPPSGRGSRDFVRSSSSRGRPSSSSGGAPRMLCISPSKLRQINDPVQRTLIQLHKIIFIDQLPPTSEVNFRRRIISRYKRALFSPNSKSMSLKDELKKLLCGSHETIDMGFVETASLAQHVVNEATVGDAYGDGITYGQMQVIIERVLKESGYYDITNSRLLNKII